MHRILLSALVIAAAAAPASSVTFGALDVQSLAELQALNAGADYAAPPPQVGPPNGANFTDGPITINSASTTDLFAGNNTGQDGVASLLFTVSIDPDDLAALGVISFDLDGDTVNLTAADFFDPDDAGFADAPGIHGIGNGQVNGISWDDSLLAGILVSVDFEGADNEDDIGDVTVTSPVNLRVDIFGVDDEGTIIKNSPNSHALGVTVPEPASIALATLGMAGLGALGRRRR